jgi:hypothetical protein
MNFDNLLELNKCLQILTKTISVYLFSHKRNVSSEQFCVYFSTGIRLNKSTDCLWCSKQLILCLAKPISWQVCAD